MILIVPHPDDELLLASSILDEVEEVVTLTYYPEELRALEQRKIAEVFGFKLTYIGLYDSWNMAPTLEVLTKILDPYVEENDLTVVPVWSGYYGSILHNRLESWANGFSQASMFNREPRLDNVKLFSEVYRSQVELIDYEIICKKADCLVYIKE